MNRLPFKPGMRSTSDGKDSQGIVFQNKEQAPSSLAELASTHALFTPCLMETIGGARFDPIEDFCQRQEEETDIFYVSTEQAVFPFLGPRWANSPFEWANTVFCCPLRIWTKFRTHLMSMAFIDPGKKLVHATTWRTIQIADPLWLSKRVVTTALPPMVAIHVFGIANEKGTYSLDPVPPLKMTTKLSEGPPEPGVQGLFTKYFPELVTGSGERIRKGDVSQN